MATVTATPSVMSASSTVQATRPGATASTIRAPATQAPVFTEARKAKKMSKVSKKAVGGGDGAKKSETKVTDTVRQTHSVSINTAVLARAGPEMTTEQPSGRGPLGHSQSGAAGVAAEHNPLWGLLREVVGPEDGNAADAEVMPGTISEETKDEEQQDEDEEKLSFD